jgi:hypothetical protein
MSENIKQSEIEFRKEQEIKPQENTISNKIGMIQSFATAIASRGFKNEKVNKPIKQLRVLSCFGNQAQGGPLPPCEHLKESTTPGKHYCGGCGCGDKKGTWLVAEGDEYSKLDYPKLNCPLQMPGFLNYKPSTPDEAVSPITRRYYIENISYKDLEKVPVTIHELPVSPPKPEQQKPA